MKSKIKKENNLSFTNLTKQFKAWKSVASVYKYPPLGWIKTIRTTMGISGEQLGNRMRLTASRICQLEKAEIEDSVSIKSLKKAAKALGCEFIYAIIPKKIK